MTSVTITVKLDAEVYSWLLAAANGSKMTVSDFANDMLESYLEDNYGEV
jgi:hypothetical protein